MGTEYVKSNVCEECPSGHTCDGASATACATTEYVKSNVCEECPNGHTCDGASATACATNEYVKSNVCEEQWLEGKTCPHGHIGTVFQGQSHSNAKEVCAAACDANPSCRFADLYLDKTCFLYNENCGDYRNNAHWAYSLYIKATATPSPPTVATACATTEYVKS